MNQREAWGAALIVAAALAGWGGAMIEAVVRAAQSQHFVLYVVVPVASIGAFLVVLALLTGVGGMLLLIPALIARIRRRKLRLATCWITGAAAAAAAPYLALLVFFAILGAAMSANYVRVEALPSSPDGRGSRTRSASWRQPARIFS
jgi:MFS family permease